MEIENNDLLDYFISAVAWLITFIVAILVTIAGWMAKRQITTIDEIAGRLQEIEKTRVTKDEMSEHFRRIEDMVGKVHSRVDAMNTAFGITGNNKHNDGQ